jgi:hypothetical protein
VNLSGAAADQAGAAGQGVEVEGGQGSPEHLALAGQRRRKALPVI